ncbi:MAG: addiction module antidote protein [Rhodomicrobium sp.]
MPLRRHPASTVYINAGAAHYLSDARAQAELLNNALASGNAAYVAQALGVIARTRGMTGVAREAGVTREAL